MIKITADGGIRSFAASGADPSLWGTGQFAAGTPPSSLASTASPSATPAAVASAAAGPAAAPAAVPIPAPSGRRISQATEKIPVRELDTPEVYNLNAVFSGNGITVSYGTTNRSKTPVLYRSTQQFRSIDDIASAELVRFGALTPFVDYPPLTGLEYFYTVLFDEDLRMGTAQIFPGANATVVGAEIPLNAELTQTSPLPAEQVILQEQQAAPLAPNAASSPVPVNQVDVPIPVQPVNAQGQPAGPPVYPSAPYAVPYTSTTYTNPPATPIETNRPVTAPAEPIRYGSASSPVMAGSDGALFPMTNTGVQGPTTGIDVPASEGVKIINEPSVFSQDLQNNYPNGEDYDLALIINGPFRWRRWDMARTELDKFLDRHEESVRKGGKQYTSAEGRARFYLAQTKYFSRDYRGALDDFRSIRMRYKDKVEDWIKSCLAMMSTS
jgi:hypothetical protein